MKGVDKAAILLLALGEKSAANVLKYIGPREVQKIGTAMTQLGSVTTTQVDDVIEVFNEAVGTQSSLGVGADAFIRNALIAAVGEEKASSLIDRIVDSGAATKGLETLKWMDPKAVFEIIRNEHPQIIAIILSFLDPDQSAVIVSLFPERDRVDLVLRVATMESVQPAALEELNVIMERHFSGNTNMQKSSLGGVKTAANMLNFVDSAVESDIIDSIKDADPDLAQRIEDLMFVFDNLVDIDDRSLQSLLREINSETLVIALKGADEALKEKIFKNMSKRAAEMLRDDLEVRGPVRVSEVEAAQKEILAVARRLSDAGEIILGGGGGEEYV
ncbi:MAG: flagellar motor switch protein FliG [Pseudomonadota bacterium]